MATTPVVHVYGRGDAAPEGAVTLNVTSRSAAKWAAAGLSPFNLYVHDVPVGTDGTRLPRVRFENYWQGLKVYYDHTPEGAAAKAGPSMRADECNNAHWKWQRKIFESAQPERFPMGRGAKPLYSQRAGHPEDRLGYVESRFKVYCPVYEAAVRASPAWPKLRALAEETATAGKELWLFDFDGHADSQAGHTLTWSLYNTRRKFGHGFVLKGMLTDDMPWHTPWDAAEEHASSVARHKTRGAGGSSGSAAKRVRTK